MQIVRYVCDGCKKDIGEKIHISIRFAVNSGVAIPPYSEGGEIYWRVKPELNGHFIHLHGPLCASRYFAGMLSIMKSAEEIRKKEVK